MFRAPLNCLPSQHLLKANDDVQVPPRKRQRIEPESSLENATEVIKAQSEAAMLLEGSSVLSHSPCMSDCSLLNLYL